MVYYLPFPIIIEYFKRMRISAAYRRRHFAVILSYKRKIYNTYWRFILIYDGRFPDFAI